MDSSIISRETIARQAAAAAEQSARTGCEAQNPYCSTFEPEHHAEFARRFYCAMQRLTTPEESEASA